MTAEILSAMLFCAAACAQPERAVKRPQVLGVAHVALYVSDLAKARAFYRDFLGYDEVYTLPGPGGADRIAFLKINEDQYIELFTDAPGNDGQLNHIALQTDNAQAMRDYLSSRGLRVPDKVATGRIGNLNFTVKDADQHTVEMVQYMPDSWTRREKGKHVPDTRISTRLYHAGILVRHLDASVDFYSGVLGLREFWRGSSNGQVLSWVNLRVPEGESYLELMLYDRPQTPSETGTKNHICLAVPDVAKAVAILEARPARKDYGRKIEAKTGVNRKRQANLYDPDGTRVEIMEMETVDGKPTPPASAPPQ